MLKIISKKEYQILLEYKNKYDFITGQKFTIVVGGRTLHNRLMNLSKEELVRLILEMREDIRKINKKLKKQYKCRVEKVED